MALFEGRKKKILAWAALGISVFLVLVLTFAWLLPRLVNLEPLKDRILAALSERAGGEIRFHEIDIAFFPRPHVTLRQGKFSIQEFAGTVESIAVYPRILPLFTGKIRLYEINMELPRVHGTLPKREAKVIPALAPDKKVADYLGRMASGAPGLSISIEGGEIRLSQAGKEVFRFEDVNARLVLPPERLKVDLNAKSNLWEKISLRGSVDAGTLDGLAEIDLLGLRPQELTAYFFSDLPVFVGDSRIDLNVRLETGQFKIWKGQVKAAIPYLTLSRGPGTLILKGKTLKGAFYTDQEKTSLSLDELDLVQPQLHLSGLLELRQTPPLAMLELTGKRMDIGSARQAALTLAPGLRTLEKVFEILNGGKSDRIVVRSKGDSISDLADLRNLHLNGNISQGKFYIPGAGLSLRDVEGEATISQGVLTAKNLKARLGNASGGQGTLKLGLKGDRSPFHLDISVQTSLTTVTSVLKDLVKDKAFQRELSLISGLNGNASGRLILGETLDSIKPRVEISGFSLTARYQRIPFPLTLKGGQFFYEEDRIRLSGISGNVGRSSFSQLSSSVSLKDAPYLEVSKGDWQISMDEAYPWISSFLGRDLSENVKSLEGMLLLNILDLKGGLLNPKDWKFRVTGEAENLLVNTPRLPGPLSMSRGGFEATPSSLSVRNFETGLLDTSLKLTGTLKGYLGTLENVDLNLQGRIGRRVVRWLFDRIDIPSEIKTRGPFAVSSSRLVWEKGNRVTLSGEFMVGRGPKISLDLVHGPRFFNIRRLLIEDEISQVFVSIDSKEKTLGVHFKGHLQATTISRLVENPFLTGWARGDLRVDVNLEKPVQSTGQGTLGAEGVLIPGLLKEPLGIERLQLSAEGNRVRVESAALALGETRLSLRGDVSVAENDFLLQMDLSSQEITWDNLEKIFEKDEKDRKGSLDLWTLPLRGKVGIRLGQFRYKDLLWKPVTAELAFHPREWVIAIQEAVACQVSTLGFLRISPQGFRQNLTLIAKDRPLGPALSCLSNSDRLARGRFELQGNLNGLAGEKPFLQSMDGDFKFTARKGTIYRFTLLTRIFALLDVTEILRGKLPDLNREGLPFDILRASGDLKDGVLTVKRGILDGPSMKIAFKGDLNLIERKMNLVLLVVPFKTLDDIIRHIPLLGRVLGKTLTSIPVQVVGDFENPLVVPLSPAAVGSELLDLLQRTLGLPLRIIEIFIPGQPSRKQ